MVDHVKKSGIGHFVNMLIWAGLADQGNKVLKYFCLDIDRSNHSAKDCAAAIKNSRIELPEDDDGNKKTFDRLSMKEKRDLLRVDQMKMLAEELKTGDGIRPSDVKYIVPQSAAMRALVARINNSYMLLAIS